MAWKPIRMRSSCGRGQAAISKEGCCKLEPTVSRSPPTKAQSPPTHPLPTPHSDVLVRRLLPALQQRQAKHILELTEQCPLALQPRAAAALRCRRDARGRRTAASALAVAAAGAAAGAGAGLAAVIAGAVVVAAGLPAGVAVEHDGAAADAGAAAHASTRGRGPRAARRRCHLPRCSSFGGRARRLGCLACRTSSRRVWRAPAAARSAGRPRSAAVVGRRRCFTRPAAAARQHVQHQSGAELVFTLAQPLRGLPL